MRRRPFPAAALLIFLAPPLLLAQEAPPLKPFRPDDDRPVMRALPVERPQTLPNPTDPAPEPSVPATPVPLVPHGTPIPVRRGKPVKSTATPAPRSAPPPPAPEPSDPGEIRMAPTGNRTPEQAQLQVADSYYSRKMYETAAPEYQRYVDQYPTSDDIPLALFRMAESYRRAGSINLAKGAYDQLLTRFPVSDYAGPGSYRLADIYYQEHNYANALPRYHAAAQRLKEPAVINAAHFYEARCLVASGDLASKMDATDLYRDLAESDRNTNPFADASRLSYALLLHERGRNTDALKQIQLLAKQADNPELKVEATVRSGLWQLDLQQPAKAAEDLKKALEMPNLGAWKEPVQVGLLRVAYDSGKYQQVVDGYREMGETISPELLPEVLLLAANSQRQLGQLQDSQALYDRLIKGSGGSIYGKEAAYQRLVILYNASDPSLLTEIDAFLQTSPEPQKRDQAMLMKAEALFRAGDYAGAAAVYAPVVLSTQLSGGYKGEALFKLGWCYAQLRDWDKAQKTFTQFIDENPTSKQLCSALVQRAIALQSLKNLAAAEKDYAEVIRKFTKCKERELALQQEARIRGQLNDPAGMVENFEKLLKDYPECPDIAEANFWIGTTAYDGKDYKKSIDHLGRARDLDKEHYFERTTPRLILAHYFLEDRDGVAHEADTYQADGRQPVQAEVLRWLGEQYFNVKDWGRADKYFENLSQREDAAPNDRLKLGQTRLEEQKYPEAVAALTQYLAVVKEPVTRVQGLLDLCRAQIGQRDFAAAQKSVNEALTLQPEGKLSGEAKILAGDIEAARGAWEEAAKLYASVSIIVDDEDVTPRALEKAADAFKKAGKDADAKKWLNQLQSRYPEYFQRPKTPAK